MMMSTINITLLDMESVLIDTNMTLVGNNYETRKSYLHDPLFEALLKLSYSNYAVTKYSISTNPAIFKKALEMDLLVAATSSDSLQDRDQKYVVYYKVSQKGRKYIMLYQQLYGLVDQLVG